MSTFDPPSAKPDGGKPARTRVLIIEDQRMVAEFLSLFCRKFGLEVVECVGRFEEGLAAVRKLRPSLVMLDLSLPDGDGLELARIILEELPEIKFLAISSHRDPWTMLQVQRVGVHGFVDKNDQRPEILAEAIETVMSGRVFYTPVVNESSATIRRDPKAFIRILSDYEIKILGLIGQAKTDEEVGAALGITASTAQSRRRNIMTKLEIHSTPKLIHYAIANGLTRTDHLPQSKTT